MFKLNKLSNVILFYFLFFMNLLSQRLTFEIILPSLYIMYSSQIIDILNTTHTYNSFKTPIILLFVI